MPKANIGGKVSKQVIRANGEGVPKICIDLLVFSL